MMQECQIPQEGILPGAVHLRLEGPRLDWDRAKDAAFSLAHTYSSSPELLGWYDRTNQAFSPEAECKEGRPGWVEHAQVRGGNLTVDVNHEEYVFIFRGVSQFP